MASWLENEGFDFYCHENQEAFGCDVTPSSPTTQKILNDIHLLPSPEPYFETSNLLPSLLFSQHETEDQEVPGSPCFLGEYNEDPLLSYLKCESGSSSKPTRNETFAEVPEWVNSSNAEHAEFEDVPSANNSTSGVYQNDDNFEVPLLDHFFEDNVARQSDIESHFDIINNFGNFEALAPSNGHSSEISWHFHRDDDSDANPPSSQSDERELDSCTSGDQLVPNIVIEE